MQIHLPVHQAARDKEFFDRVDRFLFHHQAIIHDLQHLQDPIAADHAFAHARVETVAVEVIDAIHIQLAAHELMQGAPRMPVAEDRKAHLQTAIETIVERIHHQGADVLVHDPFHDAVLQGVAERSVADIVQQDRDGSADLFLIGNVVPFAAQRGDRLTDQMHGPERVMETRVQCAGIHQMPKPELLDVAQPLEPRMIDQLQDPRVRHRDEAVDRIVEDLHEGAKVARPGRMCRGG